MTPAVPRPLGSMLSQPDSGVIPILTISRCLNIYCPECPLGCTIGHPGGQQKKFLPFGHGRDLVAFNGTGLQVVSGSGRDK